MLVSGFGVKVSSEIIIRTEPKNVYTSTFPDTLKSLKWLYEECVFFDKRDLSFVSRTARLRNSKCAGFQTNDASELESFKQI